MVDGLEERGGVFREGTDAAHASIDDEIDGLDLSEAVGGFAEGEDFREGRDRWNPAAGGDIADFFREGRAEQVDGGTGVRGGGGGGGGCFGLVWTGYGKGSDGAGEGGGDPGEAVSVGVRLDDGHDQFRSASGESAGSVGIGAEGGAIDFRAAAEAAGAGWCRLRGASHCDAADGGGFASPSVFDVPDQALQLLPRMRGRSG